MARRAQRKFLDRVDPALRESLEKSLEAGTFEPPTVTSFTMTGASSLYGAGGTPHETHLEPLPPAVLAPRRSGSSFDRLTRSLANTSTRRQALGVFGAAAAAAVGATVLKPFGAATATSLPTTTIGTCPDGRQKCGGFCCPRKATCSTAF